jgi:hypothetical protein|tara:strand:- start:2119 stop:2274 length:156 start_codon:yes stop_codon:yes gene_type:complete
MELLKLTQEIFKLNSNWNIVIGLIKEIQIKKYTQEEFVIIIDKIVKEAFDG